MNAIGAKVRDWNYRHAKTVFNFEQRYDRYIRQLDSRKAAAKKTVSVMNAHKEVNNVGRVWTFT